VSSSHDLTTLAHSCILLVFACLGSHVAVVEEVPSGDSPVVQQVEPAGSLSKPPSPTPEAKVALAGIRTPRLCSQGGMTGVGVSEGLRGRISSTGRSRAASSCVCSPPSSPQLGTSLVFLCCCCCCCCCVLQQPISSGDHGASKADEQRGQ